jgi:hypothetical protein
VIARIDEMAQRQTTTHVQSKPLPEAWWREIESTSDPWHDVDWLRGCGCLLLLNSGLLLAALVIGFALGAWWRA